MNRLVTRDAPAPLTFRRWLVTGRTGSSGARLEETELESSNTRCAGVHLKMNRKAKTEIPD